MSTSIIQKEVQLLMSKFDVKSYSYAERIDLSLDVIDLKLKEQPLVVLFHEMKKELNKMKSTL